MSVSFFPSRPDQPMVEGDAVVLLDELLRRASRARASDIHLEPKRDSLMVRFRVDGTMMTQGRVPIEVAPQVISRIKVLAGMDISERRMPQDGQFSIDLGGPTMHLRGSTFPCSHGEKIVIRILLGQSLLALEQLGMNRRTQTQVRELVSRTQGFVVSCGPTGAGKTSTLYAMLQIIDTSSVNVVTLEDPIEVDLPSITQGQTSLRTGFSFAAGLRSILRQDPDVILVGEMRDAETAAIALQASLTGHLVMSTLHTSDTVETVVRLVDLGVEPWIIASALTAIIAQRLVRVVCRACCEETRVEVDVLEEDKVLLEAGTTMMVPHGCAACRQSGFRGRTGIFEVLEINDPIRDLIKAKASPLAFREELRRQRVPGIRQVGLEKVRAGITTLQEVLRVT